MHYTPFPFNFAYLITRLKKNTIRLLFSLLAMCYGICGQVACHAQAVPDTTHAGTAFIDQYTNIYNREQLQQLQNDYNKFFDITVLFTGIGYTLQVIEAMTGAHLKNFDISRDISMHVQPVAYPKTVGLGLVVNFK